MDTNLSDDLVKLVRFSIVDIERDRERILHRGERLVTDNMTGDAFASWMIASYLQSEEETRGDWRYLRVFYEVLRRWPRQDRKFEERQLAELEGIRDAIARGGLRPRRLEEAPPAAEPPQPPAAAAVAVAEEEPPPGVYDGILERLEAHRGLVEEWRSALVRCGARIAPAIAAVFNAHRDAGGFRSVELSAGELESAFESGVQESFDPKVLAGFAGRSQGAFRPYSMVTGEATDVPPFYRWWGRPERIGDAWVQRTTVADTRYVDPSGLREPPGSEADLTVNVYRPGLGLVSWSSNHRRGRQEMPFVAYVLRKRLFWLAQIRTEALEPLVPGFLAFLQWSSRREDKKGFSLVAFPFQIDFDTCSAGVAGDSFWKGFFEVEP